MLLQLGSWFWILGEHPRSITHTACLWGDLTSTPICLYAPAYLTYIALLSGDVATVISCSLVLLLKWVMLLSVIHKPLHLLVSMSPCCCLGVDITAYMVVIFIPQRVFHMGEKVLAGLSSSLQHSASVLLLCLCLMSALLQQDDVAKFEGFD